jgi:hypothetical protein
MEREFKFNTNEKIKSLKATYSNTIADLRTEITKKLSDMLDKCKNNTLSFEEINNSDSCYQFEDYLCQELVYGNDGQTTYNANITRIYKDKDKIVVEFENQVNFIDEELYLEEIEFPKLLELFDDIVSLFEFFTNGSLNIVENNKHSSFEIAQESERKETD